MAIDWGWINKESQKQKVDEGKTFYNDKTGQYETATSGGGVGNPYATAPTANYGDPKWTPEEQQAYSLAMTQGNNALAAQIGAAAWKNYDKRRASAAVGQGNSNSNSDNGKYSNAVWNPKTGKWSVYDGTTWKDTDLTDLQANMSDALKKAKPDWYWGDQEAQGYLSEANQVRADSAATNTRFNYGSSMSF